MMTLNELKQTLSYNPNTGQFNWIGRRGGKVAGTVRKDGYKSVVINYEQHLLHRLAWLYMTGSWPTEFVDHIDGNPSNNSWDNLREATRAQNYINTPSRQHSKLGIKHIAEWTNTQDTEYYRLCIVRNKTKIVNKLYPKKKYNLDEVISMRDTMLLSLPNSDFLYKGTR